MDSGAKEMPLMTSPGSERGAADIGCALVYSAERQDAKGLKGPERHVKHTQIGVEACTVGKDLFWEAVV